MGSPEIPQQKSTEEQLQQLRAELTKENNAVQYLVKNGEETVRIRIRRLQDRIKKLNPNEIFTD